MKIPVSLVKCSDYRLEEVVYKTGLCLEKGALSVKSGEKILVKPNLVSPKQLACTHPYVTYAVCCWLKDKGAKPVIADSPGFGSAKKIARFLDLDTLLARLDLSVQEMRPAKKVCLDIGLKQKTFVPVGLVALEADKIFSVAKIKAHAQMGVTLALKNCFGCVPGFRKALCHTLQGKSHSAFSEFLIKLWENLPPVTGIIDGIVGMNQTGPRNGIPLSIGILACSENAALLDRVILDILNIKAANVPLAMETQKIWRNLLPEYPLENPESLCVEKFRIPAPLLPVPFNSFRLFKSFVKRLFAKI